MGETVLGVWMLKGFQNNEAKLKKNLHFDGEDEFLIHNLLMINYVILQCDSSLNHYSDVYIKEYDVVGGRIQ